ncbi:MAG TPA: OmpA family protein [Caulobacteraceae bacterium]|nr:OmpA family protein [Caulobacteraceae bacterium]
MKNRHIWLATALAAGGLALSACATQEYVDQSVAAHNAQNEQQFANVNARVDQVAADAQAALARANDAHKLAEGNFQHAVLFTDDSVKFDTASSQLSADAQASLTAFADKIKADNRNVYIEIQGHADQHGNAGYNNRLAQARADAVWRFLNTQGIPLYHMNQISYGESKPTGKGDAEDRRVVLIVMN